jgi:hypothetical protein
MNLFNEIERVTSEIYKRKQGKSNITHNEDEAYEIFYETADSYDIIDGVGFEVTRIAEVKEDE